MEPATGPDGGPLEVVDLGGDGRPILCLHGSEGSHAEWLAFGPALDDVGHVEAVDMIGVGRTPPAGRPATAEANRDAVISLLDERVEDLPAVLVGSSFGGLVAILVAEARPDLVEGLVLLAPGQPPVKLFHGRPGPSILGLLGAAPGLGAAFRRLRRQLLGPGRIADATLATITADPDRVPDAVRHAYRRVTIEDARSAHRDRVDSEMSRSMLRLLWRHGPYDRRVRALRVPAIVVHGDRDAVVDPDASRHLVGLRDDWDLQILEGAGHAPHVEVPDRTAAIVRGWLERQAAAPTQSGGR